jgi:hypothetical protein
MRIGLRRVAVASVLTVAMVGAGLTPGAVASQPVNAQEDAATVQRLHEELAEAVTAGDVSAIRWTLGELDPVLTGMEQRYLDGNRELIVTTRAEAAEVKQEIETLLPEKADLPSVPELLSMLLQQLLEILLKLITNLLGGGVPLPTKG